MPKEWIDVADTAVKIGLGALITGVFTYLGVKFSGKSEASKFKLEHKTKLVEKLSNDTEEYFSAWNALISPISAATSRLPHDENIESYTERNLSLFTKRDMTLRESWVKKHAVIAKLRLLNAEKATSKFEDCADLEKALRQTLWFDKNCLNFNEINEYRIKANDAQRDFSKALAIYYADM